MLTADQIKHVKSYIANLKLSLGGQFLYYCIPFRKQLVLQNMQLVFGDTLQNDEIIRLAKGFYTHVFKMLKESVMMRFMSQEQIKRRAVVIGEEHLVNVKNSQTGAVVLTGHFGSWEFAPIAGILNFTEVKNYFYFVRKAQSIKWLEKLLFKRYFDAGLGVIYKNNSLNEVYQKLDQHQIVVLVMDQHAKGKEGVMVDFFGKKKSAYRTIAMLIREMQIPAIPARSYRRNDGKHVLEFYPPMPWLHRDDPIQEITDNTLQYHAFLEKSILEYPDQWLWMYKHWREKKYSLKRSPPLKKGD